VTKPHEISLQIIFRPHWHPVSWTSSDSGWAPGWVDVPLTSVRWNHQMAPAAEVGYLTETLSRQITQLHLFSQSHPDLLSLATLFRTNLIDRLTKW